MPPRQKKPQEPHFEFFGPYLGPLGIVLGLPAVCYALVYACNAGGCLSVAPFSVPGWPPQQRFFSWEATGVFLGWMALQASLHLALPGQWVEGSALSDGSRLQYKLNGLRCFLVTLAAVLYLGFLKNPFFALNLSWAYDNYVPLMTAAVLFSAAHSLYLYARSFAPGAALAAGGATGVPLYDFFIGRELNPRLGNLDLKEFCELYPGLIGWTALNLCMAHKQLAVAGAVSTPMLLVCAFQALYVLDALYFERAILTTMDITTDGFGFMLAFGDLAWVPFTYSLQARVLVDHSPTLAPWAVAALIALKAAGYAMFRGANSQKDIFRRDPADPRVARLETLQTRRGTRLLVSGWWGAARHINYFGDWVMGWAWCLPAGAASPLPYFYVAYFGALLVHRDLRDEAACRLKYGRDWERYCKKVPYRFCPYLY